MESISPNHIKRRNQSTSLHKRAPSALPIKVNSASSCSQLPISWDATQGKAPWTVMIALTDSVPLTFNVPQASGSNFAVNWDVPKLDKSTQALVAVADSTGDVSGVSSFFDLNAGSGSCAALQVDLDFVWYPTTDKSTPGHCSNWGISWQTDPKNSGAKGTVSFTFLPENGQPLTVNAGTGSQGAFKFTVPFDSGTRFLASANDEGQSGTGGVGDMYRVSNSGRSRSCVALKTVGNGLPKGSGTLAPASSPSTSTQNTLKGSPKTSSNAAGASNTSGTNVSSNDTASDRSSSTTGTAVGATFGVLGALALLGILFWWLRRRHKAKEDEQRAWGGASSNGQAPPNVSPWRYSASPYGEPQTNSRASAWLRRASGSAATGFRILSRGNNSNNLQGEAGHARSGSITTGAQPHMQQATFRNLSAPQDDYALSSLAGANSPEHFPRSPSPTQSQKYGGGRSIHSTVPDTALFPPPGPRSYGNDEGGYGLARHQRSMQQHPSETNSPFADPVRDLSAGGVTMGGYQGPLSEIRKGTSSFDSQSNPSSAGRNLIHRSKDSSSAGGSSNSGHGRTTTDGLGSDYIAPIGPTKTSIYDPYTHMSQLWDPNSRGEIADRINQAGRGSGQSVQPVSTTASGYHGAGFTRTGPGVQRINAPITSEVMMPEQGMQKFVKTGQRKPTRTEVIDEERDELPYL